LVIYVIKIDGKFYQKFCLPFWLVVSITGVCLGQQRQLKPLVITIEFKNRAQTLENFGAAGCWYAEGIGKY
jgi:hypothetical protein